MRATSGERVWEPVTSQYARWGAMVLAITIVNHFSLCAAAQSPPPTSPAAVVVVEVGSATGNPGTQVSIDVTLETGGVDVAGVQNDIGFSPRDVSLIGCAVNPAINKTFTQFGYSVAGLRAIVFGGNLDPVPDGSVLYTCTFDVAADALPGTSSRLFNSHIIASSPSGQALPVTGGEGAIVIPGRPTRTPTPTATPTLEGTVVAPQVGTPTPARPSISVNTVRADAGEQVTIAATLSTAGSVVAGTQNDIAFDRTNAPIAAKASAKPSCKVNPDIEKTAASFAFLPPGCSSTACTGLRAVVFAIDNADPIPDGSVLYTCTVSVAVGAEDGTYPLAVSNVVLSTPDGQQVPGASGIDGGVLVGQVHGGHKPSDDPHATPPVPGPAGGLGAGSDGAVASASGGCAVVPGQRAGGSVVPLLGGILLLWRRRASPYCCPPRVASASRAFCALAWRGLRRSAWS